MLGSDSLDGMKDRFGPLLSIPPPSIIKLAHDVATQKGLKPRTKGKLLERLEGSNNLIHTVDFGSIKLVVRIPAIGFGSRMTAIAAQALESQVATLRVIRKKTSLPVPEVYSHDTTSKNEIGAPYICMSFMPGQPAYKLWFSPQKSRRKLTREQLRLNILTSVANAMAKLSSLTFDKMGSIQDDGLGGTTLGPCYEWDEKDDASRGSSSRQKPASPGKRQGVGDTHIDSLPAQHTFVLDFPDFDLQNVLVDPKGNVTGLVDWDLVQTVPRYVGYARHPGWITRDWDPLMYTWPQNPDREDSPELLEKYREYYHRRLGQALSRKGDWECLSLVFNQKSHLFEAVWNAALLYRNRLEICRKFVQVAVGDDTDALTVLHSIGAEWIRDEDWTILQSKLRQMLVVVANT
ncbi:kinase-like domain-containing protein [Apiosordaria backusii]|uniref:Kinase-like domain-containing protein n=1 Tax=Apiosordaria backusii TaxID=314023 RepID=A0AA40EI77_9PEZI|nr:kinase-like domain-containing protein [Apiosordaria backusii]